MDANKPKSPSKDSKEKGKQITPKKQKMQELRVEFLSQNRAEEAAQLYTYAFIEMNSMWKKLSVNYDQIFSLMVGRMISCCRAGWAYSMVNPINGQLAAIVPSMDLYDYIDALSMPNNSQFNKVLGRYAAQLQNDYFQSLRPTLKKGEALYGYGGTLHPKYANAGVSKKLWALGFVSVKVAGWKTYYTRASNRITTKVLKLFGAKVIKVVPINEEGVQGEFLQLIKFDLADLSYSTLSHFYDEKPEGVDEQQY